MTGGPDLRAGRIRALAESVRRGDTPVEAVLAEVHRRIGRRDPHLQAFSQVFAEPARHRSRSGALAGIPLAVKDNIDVAGSPTALGRPLQERPPAPRHAPVVSALVDAGAIVVGKTTMPEFASSPITRNTVTGVTRNPHDPSRTAGGSSGGSAAAVASGMVMAALGTDTGGSVVLPAALNGVLGLRPTHGVIPTEGVFPLAWSLDTVGFLAAAPDDLDAVWTAARAATLVRRPDTHRRPASRRDLRIGVLEGWAEGADGSVAAGFETMLQRLRSTGGTLRPGVTEDADRLMEQARIIYLAEMAAALRDLPLADPPYAPDVCERRRRGAEVTGIEYAVARRQQRRWRAELARLFDDNDLLVVPTTPVVAPEIDAHTDPAELMRFAYPMCFAGVPALSIPCPGRRPPVGVLLVAPWHGEDTLIELAARLSSPADIPAS